MPELLRTLLDCPSIEQYQDLFAVEADSSLQKLASDVVSSYTQKDVELVAQTDPRIVGGLALEFDNRMYDARISTHLAKLRIEFAKNIYESKL